MCYNIFNIHSIIGVLGAFNILVKCQELRKMKYTRPEIKTERFDLVDEVRADASSELPPDYNGNYGGDLNWEETSSAFSEAFGNIFNI